MAHITDNFLTEDKAKTKWCTDRSMRLIFISLTEIIASNLGKNAEEKGQILDVTIGTQKDNSPNCIASDCIQWKVSGYEKLGYCGLGNNK